MNRASGNSETVSRVREGPDSGISFGKRGAAILMLSAVLTLPSSAFPETGAGPFSGPSAAGGETLLFQEIPSVYSAS